MPLSEEPSSIETALEAFRVDLENAVDFASEFEARTSLHDLPSFEELTGHEEEIMAALAEYFGFDLANPNVVKTETMPGPEGAGETTVSVIATNNPDVFIGKYAYADGDVDWAIRPLEFEEF